MNLEEQKLNKNTANNKNAGNTKNKGKKKLNISSIILSAIFIACAVMLIQLNTGDTGVKMDEKMSDIVGSKGTQNFVSFFTKLDSWYGKYSPEDDSVILSTKEDENRLDEVKNKYEMYLESWDKIKDEGELEEIKAYSKPMTDFYDGTLSDIADSLAEDGGTAEFTKQEWNELGEQIKAIIENYSPEE